MQFQPEISTNDPVYGAMTLTFLIALGMLKEFLADYKRWKTDKISNANPVKVLTGNH